MGSFELVGGPMDGACAEDRGEISEGDHVVVEFDDCPKAIYTLRNGLLEFDADLTFGEENE